MTNTSEQLVDLRGSESFIRERQPNLCIRILRIVDIFSFLPVPKDESVSTKSSIIGSLLLFVLFLTYVIYDFVMFVQSNPPIIQIYRTSLDNQAYRIPQFAIAFMSNDLNNYTEIYDGLFSYSMQTIVKSQGNQTSSNITFKVAEYNTTGNDLGWMSDATKKFYYVMRYPTQDMYAEGLLYSTDENTYIRVKMSYCANQSCLDANTTALLSSFGRAFLFIQNQPDTSIISRETAASNGNNYLIYNFFVMPGFYKRININFQVVETTVHPDYFQEFTEQVTTKLQIQSVTEELSVVNFQSNSTDAIAFNMQLSSTKLKNKVSRSTIIDHLSRWGALWGVLFAVFSLIFFTFNRKKYYRQNPDWDHFKKELEKRLKREKQI